jgi:predicted transcriptional regulator
MIDSVKKQAITDLAKRRYTITEISQTLGISRPTVYKYLRNKPVDKSTKTIVKKSLLTMLKIRLKIKS